MTEVNNKSSSPRWLEWTGLPHLARIPALAARVDNLAIGIGAIFASIVFGTLLDWTWSLRGGVSANAVSQFVLSRQLDQPYSEPSGDLGIFHVWRDHERHCVDSLLRSFLPGKSYASGTALGRYLDARAPAHPGGSFADMAYGLWWLWSAHPFFSLILFAGLLIIWSIAGGAICRIAAVQFAQDDLLTAPKGLKFARGRLWNGFVTAPCLPLSLCLVILLMMALGGAFLRIPLVGDLLGGAAFPLAILGGAIVAALLIGLATGGHLYWPCVATESGDGFDAFSRGLSYVFLRPWKAIWYAVFTLFFASVCWMIANLGVLLALGITRAVVSWGTSPFGWWKRPVGDLRVSKLELLWPLGGSAELYRAPQWGNLGFFEYISAVFIGFWVLVVIVSLWSFLASFYYCSCTVSYFLLRRDVDGIDLEEVASEDDEEDEEATGGVGPGASSGSGGSLPPSASAETQGRL